MDIEKLVERNVNVSIMDDEKFESLKKGIKNHGIKHDILVRPAEDGKYEIIDGHHRVRAAKEIGWDEISDEKIDVEEADDEKARVLNFRLNYEDGEIDPKNEAKMYKKELERGKTQEEVADMYGVSARHVRARTKILDVDEGIRKKFINGDTVRSDDSEKSDESEGENEGDFLTVSHLEAIAKAPSESRSDLAEDTEEKNLSVREVEDKAKRLKQEKEKGVAPEEKKEDEKETEEKVITESPPMSSEKVREVLEESDAKEAKKKAKDVEAEEEEAKESDVKLTVKIPPEVYSEIASEVPSEYECARNAVLEATVEKYAS